MATEIICPNCGSRNERYGECQYCGTVITAAKKVADENDLDDDVVVSHGPNPTPIDSRFFRQVYDKYKDSTTTYYRSAYSNGCFKNSTLYFYHVFDKDGLSNFILKDQDGRNIIINADGVNYTIGYYEYLDEDILRIICESDNISIALYDGDKGSEVKRGIMEELVCVARLYYNTFIDNTMFTDAGDAIISLWQRREAELAERKERQRKSDAEGFTWFIIVLLAYLGAGVGVGLILMLIGNL